jgi:hypothetical protein
MVFGVTRNPVFVWRAYRLAKETGLTPPQWIEAHFLIVSGNIEARTGDRAPKGEIAAAVSEAFGFIPGGELVAWRKRMRPGEDLAAWVRAWRKSPNTGQQKLRHAIMNDIALQSLMLEKPGNHNPFTDSNQQWNEFVLASSVYFYLREGHQLTYARQHAALEHEKSEATARRAWDKYQPVFPRLSRSRGDRDTK